MIKICNKNTASEQQKGGNGGGGKDVCVCGGGGGGGGRGGEVGSRGQGVGGPNLVLLIPNPYS